MFYDNRARHAARSTGSAQEDPIDLATPTARSTRSSARTSSGVLTKELSLKERLIVLLYYFEELTMREIGVTLDLSESRVCQLHSRIVARLRAKLGARAKELRS